MAGTYVAGLVVTDGTGRSSSVATLAVTADPAVGVGLPPNFTIATYNDLVLCMGQRCRAECPFTST